ncbi:hypothetical protein [Bacillus sp. B-jedd]|uniref:hypothetical protein n=1 Tax=Bacillus sp. B-jedd TaxID=1476857 RepID=UPI000515698F|nr:hypothetical protein [Bacillus sp. B-jedd]CEG25749.1 protein YoqH [Bacillus sp. B-jedd]
MKRLLIILVSSYFLFIPPDSTEAAVQACSMVLEPLDKSLINVKGAALVYQVQLRPPSSPRTNISIVAAHLPEPSTLGNYDTYEGFAAIPDVISWRFPLTPDQEKELWAGKFDEITAKLKNAEIEVRLSNSKTGKLGPVILKNGIRKCK